MPPRRPLSLSFALRGVQAAAANTLIALGLTAFGDEPFGRNLLYSQGIGLSIWAAIDGGQMLLIRDWSTQWRRMVAIAPAGVAVGYAVGIAATDRALGRVPFVEWAGQPRRALGFLVLSLGAGVVVTYWFASREHMAQARERQAQLQREATEARLKLLETQLAPHMLFNTLANLRALIAVDAPRAQQMLDHLIAYLRATLGASRSVTHPLAAEFQRLHDYLALMAIRMGPRLAYELHLPPQLAQQPVPTLLLQPLVENSLQHGLEPQVRGGRIVVDARREGGMLVLEVADTGAGLAGTPPADGHGFGLGQVRDRLATLFGPAATLELAPIASGGTRTTIRLPLPA
ncbi:sensor histidine kinase [Ramlibacter tataouinensis]|nr:histidine kinase [Ramlibacter tataouinensis]